MSCQCDPQKSGLPLLDVAANGRCSTPDRPGTWQKVDEDMAHHGPQFLIERTERESEFEETSAKMPPHL